MRSEQSEPDKLDREFTCGQMGTMIALIIVMVVIYPIIDLVISATGWIALFFIISTLALLHSINMGIALVITPVKLEPSGSSLQESPKVNVIDHMIFSVVFGAYFIFTTSLFLKLLYLLFGGFSHATSNYWDWFSFTLYSAIDQIFFGLPSILLSISHITFISTQATQTGQKIAVYLSTLVFALLFWASFLKFCKMLKKDNFRGTAKRIATPKDDRLSNRFALVISFTSFTILIIDIIIIGSIEWLMSFTGKVGIGFILSAIPLVALIFALTTLIRLSDKSFSKFLSNPALSHRSTREKFFVLLSIAGTLISSYLIFAALFFQSLSLLSGGSSPATSNYGDWFIFVSYSAVDQISFNAVSIFHLYPETIQATQTCQQIMVFLLINLMFTLLLGGAFAKFYWPKISVTQRQLELEKELADFEAEDSEAE